MNLPLAADVHSLRSALVADPIDDLSGLADALLGAALPVDDLQRPGRRFFRFASAGTVVGYGGFELYGHDALLRSIVVLPEARGRGMGAAIVERLVAEVAAAGATRAYLITTTATAFFERHGFRAIDRSAAPPAILATAQAAEICSTTAPLLMRTLERRA